MTHPWPAKLLQEWDAILASDPVSGRVMIITRDEIGFWGEGVAAQGERLTIDGPVGHAAFIVGDWSDERGAYPLTVVGAVL